MPAIPARGLDDPSFVRGCTVPYVTNLVCDPAATTEDGDTVCKEQNYGRKNPKGETCCCKGEFCNGPIVPTWAPTTEPSITSTSSFDTTENMIDETNESVSMDLDQHDMSTQFPDYSTEEDSGASGLTSHLVIYLFPCVFLFCTFW